MSRRKKKPLNFFRTIGVTEKYFTITIPADHIELHREAKQLPGAWWWKQYNCYAVARSHQDAVFAFAKQYSFGATPEVLQIINSNKVTA